MSTSSGRLVDLDHTVWGWAQILVATLVAVAGVMVFAGKGLGPGSGPYS